MDDLTGKLNEILSNPQAMEQVNALAGMLGLGSDAAASGGASSSAPASEPSSQSNPPSVLGNLGNLSNAASSLGGLGALGGLFGGNPGGNSGSNPLAGMNGEMMQAMIKLLSLLNSFQQEDDNTKLFACFATAAGRRTRKKKLDEAVKIMQMLRAVATAEKSRNFVR